MNPAGCGVVEQGGGHLGATGVVDANEQDFGDLGHEHSLGVGGCGEPVGGESARQVRHVRGDAGGGGEPGVGVLDDGVTVCGENTP